MWKQTRNQLVLYFFYSSSASPTLCLLPFRQAELTMCDCRIDSLAHLCNSRVINVESVG